MHERRLDPRQGSHPPRSATFRISDELGRPVELLYPRIGDADLLRQGIRLLPERPHIDGADHPDLGCGPATDLAARLVKERSEDLRLAGEDILTSTDAPYKRVCMRTS